MARMVGAMNCRLTLLVAPIMLGGCYTSTVTLHASWPEGVEVLAAPPPSEKPIAMIDTTSGLFGSPEGCREELAHKAKELGATSIYVPTESRSFGFFLEIFWGNEVACRAFAYASAAAAAPQEAPPVQPAPAPTPTAKPRR